MLTSEYVALDGALVLAVPTKTGQEFFFEEYDDGNSTVFWEAYHQDRLWLSAEINYTTWNIITAKIPKAAEFIVNVLRKIQQLSSQKFQNRISYKLKTNLQFPANFGLGSSSTLMNNLAEWSGTDPYQLNELCLGGSGYDIAVAHEKSAVLFSNNEGNKSIQKVEYKPPFSDQIIFIHLNKKQNSRAGISLYKSRQKSPELISEFSDITQQIFETKSLATFSELLTLHEEKLSQYLDLITVKEKYFTDCPVFVKSLGAWGGDFIMSRKFEGFREYFREKWFSNILEWDELIY